MTDALRHLRSNGSLDKARPAVKEFFGKFLVQ
jgi:hypothetical protein